MVAQTHDWINQLDRVRDCFNVLTWSFGNMYLRDEVERLVVRWSRYNRGKLRYRCRDYPLSLP